MDSGLLTLGIVYDQVRIQRLADSVSVATNVSHSKVQQDAGLKDPTDVSGYRGYSAAVVST